jgi:hypothetical protein
MSVSLQAGQVVQGIVSGLDVNGNPTQAVLSNLTFNIVDATVATGVLDTTTPNAIDVTGVGLGTSGSGSTQITFTATATDPDGAVNTVSGSATIIVSAVGPAQQTVSLGIVWGTLLAPSSAKFGQVGLRPASGQPLPRK